MTYKEINSLIIVNDKYSPIKAKKLYEEGVPCWKLAVAKWSYMEKNSKFSCYNDAKAFGIYLRCGFCFKYMYDAVGSCMGCPLDDEVKFCRDFHYWWNHLSEALKVIKKAAKKERNNGTR